MDVEFYYVGSGEVFPDKGGGEISKIGSRRRLAAGVQKRDNEKISVRNYREFWTGFLRKRLNCYQRH